MGLQIIKNRLLNINKKWFLLAALPLMAAVWKLTDEYTGGYYHRPLNIATQLAANFGEVRENHFHMGLDVRTNGRQNMPVYAAADGYISHATIEETGYGHALYVTHPNGTTTLYAHLNRFMDELETYVHTRQYTSECWQQNITLPPGKFTVYKGQQIALSGNTGTSEGPHLHVEIRDTRTGANLNPLTHGIIMTDDVPPAINSFYWYNKTASIYNATANKIAIRGGGGQYTSAVNTVMVNTPDIMLGLGMTDKNTQSKYTLGIYKALLYVDDKLSYSFTVDSFNAADTRYVNACIDYNNWVHNSRCIQLLGILPGNKLPVFQGSPSNGVIHVEDRKPHAIKVILNDAAGNTTTLQTIIQYNGNMLPAGRQNNAQVLLPGNAGKITTANAVIYTGRKTLYDAAQLHPVEETGEITNSASNAVFIHDASIPIHDSIMVKIKTTLPVGSPLRRHTVMLLTNEKSSYIIKGTWQGDYMVGACPAFGTVQLIIDTISPELNFKEGDNSILLAGENALHITYKDNMGEAAFFRGEIDGHWVLFEKKGDVFTYNFDEHCKPGKHTLQVMAGDKAGNITVQQLKFTYR